VKRLEGYRNFCNKIWNAARYVQMNTQDDNGAALDCGQNGGEIELSVADRWIISRLQHVEAEVEKYYEQYRFDLMSQTLYDFIWNEYCDWYLELSKPVFWNENSTEAQLRGTRQTLVRVLESTLRLLHPIMPFITEEIWQSIKELAGAEGDSIILQAFPVSDESKIDTQAEQDIEWLKGVIVGVRNIRGEMNIAPSKALDLLFRNGSEDDKQRLDNNETFLKALAKLETITWLNEGDEAPMSATQLVGQMEVLVPMAGLIDKDAEIARLNKELEKLQKEIGKISGKLNNENFVSKAPEAVVAKEKAKLEEMSAASSKLNEQMEAIKNM